MTLTTLQPHLDTAVAHKTANSVLNRVFFEIKGMLNASEYSDEWVQQGMDLLRFSRDIEIGFGHSKILLLAIFKEKWDDIPLEFRKQHGFQFINFAKLQSGGKAKSTIDNYIATARIWLIDEYGTGKRIEVKKRSAEGKPILENGKEVTEIVEFCPYSVDVSKLEILNSRARNDDMTDKLWEMLVDEFYTCDDIRAEHSRGEEKGEVNGYVLRYALSGPSLVVYQNGNEAVIGELNWEEYENDPLVKEAIDTILKILNIEMEEDKIYKMVKEMYK